MRYTTWTNPEEVLQERKHRSKRDNERRREKERKTRNFVVFFQENYTNELNEMRIFFVLFFVLLWYIKFSFYLWWWRTRQEFSRGGRTKRAYDSLHVYLVLWRVSFSPSPWMPFSFSFVFLSLSLCHSMFHTKNIGSKHDPIVERRHGCWDGPTVLPVMKGEERNRIFHDDVEQGIAWWSWWWLWGIKKRATER